MADKEKPDISKEELEQFTKALKDEKFKKLFKDYVEELRDPANRELYEREISAMEREKGVDTTWIHPTPVYVVKSVLSDEPKEKIFINVCSSPDVEQASVKKNKGQHWTIPHILLTSTYRMDTDKSGNACRVQDVVFHPATLTKMGETNELSRLLAVTAIEAIEKQANVKISKEYSLPKLKVKGSAPAPSILRTKNSAAKSTPSESSLDFIKKFAEKQEDTDKKEKAEYVPPSPVFAEGCETPTFKIIHQGLVSDYQKYTDTREKDFGARPDALLVKIHLPRLKNASNIDLDTTEKKLELDVPDVYKLSIDLPFPVDHDNGKAKFDKSKCELCVTLPVIAFKHPLSVVPPQISVPLQEEEVEDDVVEAVVEESPALVSESDVNEIELVKELMGVDLAGKSQEEAAEIVDEPKIVEEESVAPIAEDTSLVETIEDMSLGSKVEETQDTVFQEPSVVDEIACAVEKLDLKEDNGIVDLSEIRTHQTEEIVSALLKMPAGASCQGMFHNTVNSMVTEIIHKSMVLTVEFDQPVSDVAVVLNGPNPVIRFTKEIKGTEFQSATFSLPDMPARVVLFSTLKSSKELLEKVNAVGESDRLQEALGEVTSARLDGSKLIVKRAPVIKQDPIKLSNTAIFDLE